MGRLIHSNGFFYGRNLCRGNVALVVAIVFFLPHSVKAQFLRLGPFDFSGKAHLDGVYSSNIEKVRPSEATEAQEDFYILSGIDLNTKKDVGAHTAITLDSGVSVEKHLNRPDLDNSSSPFGRFRANSLTELGHYNLSLDAGYSRSSQSAEDRFVPGGRKKRDVNDLFTYGLGLSWDRNPLHWEVRDGYKRERHQDAEFKDGDLDENDKEARVIFHITPRLGLSGGLTKRVISVVGGGNQAERHSDTYNVGIFVRLLQRPTFVYTLGLQRQDEDEEKGNWDLTHNFSLSDSRKLTQTLTLALGASYSIEKQEEAQDINFQYNGTLLHEISSTSHQSLGVTRQPVSTFGSTTDSDSTTLNYNFAKTDLFIYNLDFTFSAVYSHIIPKGENAGPIENTMTYSTQLAYSQAITRKLRRVLKYNYSHEDSSAADEPLQEHRVTLSFEYSL